MAVVDEEAKVNEMLGGYMSGFEPARASSYPGYGKDIVGYLEGEIGMVERQREESTFLGVKSTLKRREGRRCKRCRVTRAGTPGISGRQTRSIFLINKCSQSPRRFVEIELELPSDSSHPHHP
jgi:hypothetical protein